MRGLPMQALRTELLNSASRLALEASGAINLAPRLLDEVDTAPLTPDEVAAAADIVITGRRADETPR